MIAVVLGGGGPLGLGWEVGLIEGLAEAGVDLGHADTIVGTSAGSAVGAALASGVDFGALLAAAARPLPLASDQVVDLTEMQSAVAAAAAGCDEPSQAAGMIGRLAAASKTADEQSFLESEMFSSFRSSTWPATLRCTAINIETGVLTAWTRSDGADLARAIAASCAVPTIFPPVTIDGVRYMDGGMISPTNASLAAGHDTVLVVSCYALTLPDGFENSGMAAAAAMQRAELEGLRRGGSMVTVIEPDDAFLALSGWGAEAMSVDLVAPAYRLGKRLGSSLAPQVSLDAAGLVATESPGGPSHTTSPTVEVL